VRRVVFFALVLSYRRCKFYLPSSDETQGSIYEEIERGFAPFGSAPKESLVDNAKAFTLDARPDALTWNPHVLELCDHYRVEPRHCQVRRAQTKGKVERPFFFLEQHFIKGRAFRDFDHLPQGAGTLLVFQFPFWTEMVWIIREFSQVSRRGYTAIPLQPRGPWRKGRPEKGTEILARELLAWLIHSDQLALSQRPGQRRLADFQVNCRGT
jgi:hypothetical protein